MFRNGKIGNDKHVMSETWRMMRCAGIFDNMQKLVYYLLKSRNVNVWYAGILENILKGNWSIFYLGSLGTILPGARGINEQCRQTYFQHICKYTFNIYANILSTYMQICLKHLCK